VDKGRGEKQYGPLTMLVAGSTVGGVILGGILWGIWLGLAQAEIVLAAVAVSGTLVTFHGWKYPRVRSHLPERKCQVSRTLWHTHSLEAASFRWGVTLGLGVCTFAVTPGLYSFLTALVTARSPFVLPGIGAAYGLTRGGCVSMCGTPSLWAPGLKRDCVQC